jgi:hypothetical protein
VEFPGELDCLAAIESFATNVPLGAGLQNRADTLPYDVVVICDQDFS